MSYLCEKLKPNTSFKVSVRMINDKGQGPPAIARLRTNPAPKVEVIQPIISLILVGDHSVDLSSGNNLKSDKTIYTNDRRIVGTAVHVARNLLFVSDEAQFIYRTEMERTSPMGGSDRMVIRQPKPNDDSAPLDLSMDWLNNYLYFIVQGRNKWWISRCDLYGRGEQVVYSGLIQKPSHFEVDPYNG